MGCGASVPDVRLQPHVEIALAVVARACEADYASKWAPATCRDAASAGVPASHARSRAYFVTPELHASLAKIERSSGYDVGTQGGRVPCLPLRVVDGDTLEVLAPRISELHAIAFVAGWDALMAALAPERVAWALLRTLVKRVYVRLSCVDAPEMKKRGAAPGGSGADEGAAAGAVEAYEAAVAAAGGGRPASLHPLEHRAGVVAKAVVQRLVGLHAGGDGPLMLRTGAAYMAHMVVRSTFALPRGLTCIAAPGTAGGGAAHADEGEFMHWDGQTKCTVNAAGEIVVHGRGGGQRAVDKYGRCLVDLDVTVRGPQGSASMSLVGALLAVGTVRVATGSTRPWGGQLLHAIGNASDATLRDLTLGV